MYQSIGVAKTASKLYRGVALKCCAIKIWIYIVAGFRHLHQTIASMNRVFIGLFAFFFLHAVATPLHAQNVPSDTSFRQASINKLVALYHTSVGPASNLYNGTQYEFYPFPFQESHPYFETSSFTSGTVTYSGVTYTGVPLLYDIVRDELVLLHYDSIHRVSLVNENTASFSLAGHHFIRIERDSTQKVLPAGFYDELHQGQVSFLVKRTKDLEEVIDNRNVVSRVVYKKRYFVLNGGAYYAVKNKKALLRLFKDKKNEIQQFIKQDKISFKRNEEMAMKSVVAYYDQLIKQL